METLMILTYTAFCYAIFKVFKIPLNKWTVPTAVLGGVAMIGTVILLMNYNHPYTKVAQTYTVVTPIVPTVKGRVIEVPVTPNTLIKQGEVLFRIEATPFQTMVDQKKAALATAVQNVNINREAWKQTVAAVDQAKAERNRTKVNYDRYAKANKKSPGGGPFSAAQVQNRRDSYLAAEARLNETRAAQRRAKLIFETQINGESTEVVKIRAELVAAEFDLDQTVVRAPTDGMVTQVALRPGMMAVPFPLAPVMTFIHDEPGVLIASFQQNLVQRLKVGGTAEVIFKSIPGRLFTGKITVVFPIIAEGGFQASGQLKGQRLGRPGRAPVAIELDDDMSEFNLPIGAVAEVAVITEHVVHVAIIRRILLRMTSWQNYVFSEGH